MPQQPYVQPPAPPQAGAMSRNAWRASNPVFHSKSDGDWGHLGTALEDGARQAAELNAHPLSRKQQVHKAFESMDPEELMSGYHLAGGANPGEHLGHARKTWFQQHLASQAVQRGGGSVIGKTGDSALRAKRAQITKSLLKIASAPERRLSHGDEPEKLGVAGRTFAREAHEEATARRDAFSTSMAGDDSKSGAGQRGGGEAQRLNALKEKEVLESGVSAAAKAPPKPPDAYAQEQDSLQRGIRSREREEERRRETRRREVLVEKHIAREHRDVEHERRERSEEEAATREKARQKLHEAARKKVWSDSKNTRAAAGFQRASKLQKLAPYKAAMTGSVFEHFLQHPNPRQFSGQPVGGTDEGGAATARATHSSEAAMVAKAGVRTHNFEGREVPSGYTGFAGF